MLPAMYLLVWMVPYRKARVMAFMDPWADPLGSGFQIIQSLIALGSGGISGVGLGESRQKLLYLPASTTDFIFAALGEELGMAGAFAIIVLFAILVERALRGERGTLGARRCPALFSS